MGSTYEPRGQSFRVDPYIIVTLETGKRLNCPEGVRYKKFASVICRSRINPIKEFLESPKTNFPEDIMV